MVCFSPVLVVLALAKNCWPAVLTLRASFSGWFFCLLFLFYLLFCLGPPPCWRAAGRAERGAMAGFRRPPFVHFFICFWLPHFRFLSPEVEPKATRAMKHLQIHNPRFITYSDSLFTADVLGGVDLQQIERMICTLRITYQGYPPLRTTLDLYSDQQTDKLIRTLCDKWQLPLLEVSKSVHDLVGQLETYKLKRLQYPEDHTEQPFELSEGRGQASQKVLIGWQVNYQLAKRSGTARYFGRIGKRPDPLFGNSLSPV